jgi:hypothetical protein
MEATEESSTPPNQEISSPKSTPTQIKSLVYIYIAILHSS